VFSKGRVVPNGTGQGVRMVGIGQDVTERRQLEALFRQSQKLEAVGLLAGGVAHDFNNLITAIGGYTELVLGKLPHGDSRRPDLMEVQKAVDRAAALTRRLLAFSRRQTLQLKVVDLNALVLSMENLLRRTIGDHIELILQLDPDLEPIRADPGQLEQVLLNLALNARDAMPDGGRLRFATSVADFDESWARLHPPMAQGRYVHLVVTDTGIGMSPETQGRIFEPFFTTKPAGQGTGFGLATVYSIIKQSGGFIRVTSQLGRGASFDISLPAVRQAVEPIEPTPPPDAVGRGSETILLVEDDAAVRRLAQTVLQGSGYLVLDARDGEEALALTRGRLEAVDLLITDVVMPGVNGRELAMRLKSTNPVLRVLYTSGYSKEATSSVGIDDSAPFLPKPFLPLDLLEKVREVLSASGSSVV
jgi:nitrogen-specific signal transduction histidine kinase